MSKCKWNFNGKQLNENELNEEYNMLQVDVKFSPVQLSDVLQKDYYDVLLDSEKSTQDIILDLARDKQIDVEVVFDDVKLMWYNDEVPNFKSLNGNLNEAKKALLKDREVIDTINIPDLIQEPYLDKYDKIESKATSVINYRGKYANEIKILGYNKDNYRTIIETTKSLPNLFEVVGLITTSSELKSIAKTINNSKLNRIINKLDLSSTVLEINNKTIKGMFYEDMSEILKDLGVSDKNNIIVLEEGYDIETRLIHEGAHKHNDITGIPEQNFTQDEMLILIDTLQKKAISETTVLDVKDYIIQSIKKGKTTEIIPNLYQLFKESPIEAKKIFSKELLSLLENDGMFVYGGVPENIQSFNRYSYNELQIQKISKIPLNKDGLNNKYNINEEGEQTYLTKEGYVVVHVGYETYTAIIDKVDIKDITNLPSIKEFQQLIDYSDTVKTINRLSENENNYEYLAAEEKGYYQWKQDVEIAIKNYIDKYDKNNKFYQLESNSAKQKLINEEVIVKLKSFLNTQGFEASVITEFEKHQEANGKEFKVNGFVDLLDKVVRYDEQSLPEEVAHVAVELFLNDGSTILEQVAQTELYKTKAREYKKIYKDETKVRKEILGQLMAQQIIKKNKEGIDGRLSVRIKRLWDKFVSWVKDNKELMDFIDEVSTKVLTNQDGRIDKVMEGTYYQIDSSKFKNSKLLDNFKEELETVIRGKTARMKIYAAKAVKSFGKSESRRIAELNKDLSNDKITLGIVSFLNQTETEGILIQNKMVQLLEKYDKLTTKEKASLLNDMQAFLQAYEEPLRSIQSDIEFYPIDEKYDEIKTTLDNTIKLIGKVKTQYKKIGTVLFAETLYPFASKNPEITNIEDLIKKLESQEDIGMYRRLLNSMADSTDDVLATVDQLVKQHKERARLKSEDKIKEILKAETKLKVAGIKSEDFMFEEGTGNFVTRYKQKEYQDAINKHRGLTRTKYALPESKWERESFLNVYNDFKIKTWLNDNTAQLQPLVDSVKKSNHGATHVKIRELVWLKMKKEYKMSWAKWHNENSQVVDNANEVIREELQKFYDSQVFESERKQDSADAIFDNLVNNKKLKLNLTVAENKAKELFEEWLEDRRRYSDFLKDFYYVYELSQPADKYLNTQFDEIQSNPVKKEYYDKVMEAKENSDKFLPERFVNRYLAPQIRMDWLARIKSGGLGKLKEEIKDTVAVRESDTDWGQLVVDEDGNVTQFVLTDEKNNPVNFLPIHFVNEIPDLQDMSKDVTSIMASYMSMAENYNEMNKIIDVLELGNEVLAQRKVEVGENILGKTIELFKGQKAVSSTTGGLAYQRYVDYMEMVVYGKMKAKEPNKFLNKLGIDQAKLVDTFNKYTAIQGLALNVFSGVNNVVIGNAMARQEAFAGEYATHADFAKADKTYWSEVPKVLADVGENLSSSKLRLFEEHLDIFQDYKQRLHELETERSKFGRLFNTSSLFILSKLGEHQVQLRTALAIAYNTKVKVNGIESSVWDALEVSDYRLHIKPNTKKLDGTDFTQDDLIEMSLRIRGLNNRLHGVYSDIDRSAIQKWSIGRMMLLFRKFVVPGFNRRWEKKRFDFDSNLEVEGYYRSAFKFFSKLFEELRAGQLEIKSTWADLTPLQRANVIRTFVDVAYALLTLTLIGVLSNIEGDDDDNWALNMTSLTANRFYTDIRFFSSPKEFIRLMKSPAVGVNQLTNLTNYSKTIDPFGYIFGDDPFIREMKSGKNKGDTYFWVNLKKTVPLWHNIEKTFVPEEQLIFYSN